MDTRRLWTGIALAGLLLVACGGGGAEQAKPGSEVDQPAEAPEEGGEEIPAADACALLTEEEIQGASGAAVTETVPTDEGQGTQRCTWSLESPDPDIPSTVGVVLYTQNGRGLFDSAKPGTQYGGSSEPVEGIGDDAYMQITAGAPTLQVLVGEVSFFVQYVPGLNDPNEGGQAEEIVKELAPLVVGRVG